MSLTLLTVTRSDSTQFKAVGQDDEISIDNSGPAPVIVFVGVNWVIADGVTPTVKGTKSVIAASSSRLFVQHLAGTGSNPSTTRYVLLESTGMAVVTELDGSNEVALGEGYLVDVTNSEPPVIGQAQEYVPATHSSTATAIQTATTAFEELENPDD